MKKFVDNLFSNNLPLALILKQRVKMKSVSEVKKTRKSRYKIIAMQIYYRINFVYVFVIELFTMMIKADSIRKK